MAFSTGAHVCLGAWLGRSTVRVAVQRLFERVPQPALAGDVEIRGFEFRGPTSLLVADRARQRWSGRVMSPVAGMPSARAYCRCTVPAAT